MVSIPHQLLIKQKALGYIAFAIAGLLFCSVMLSYLFQELVFHTHCLTKLSIILSGNLLFWTGSWPLIATLANKTFGRKYCLPVRLGTGVLLLYVNQVFVQKCIYIIFLYGFGCLEGVTNACYMLFENNILTACIIYSILALAARERAMLLKQAAPGMPDPVFVDQTTDPVELPAFKSHLFIKSNGTSVKVNVQQIRYIEACKNTILIFTDDKKHVLYQSMASVEKELDPELFVRIHRSVIVNRSFIRSYGSLGNGNTSIKLSCGTELVMTRHYKTPISL